MFNKRLKQLRKEKKLTREQLAEKLDITYYALSKYETGDRQPDYQTLKKIADFFDVSTDYLLGRSDDPRLTAEQEKEVYREFEEIKAMIEKLPEEKKKRILQRLLDFTKGAVDD